MQKINESVFKAYDIRGIYPEQINEDFAYQLGRGYATFLLRKNPQARCVVVGQDMRLSSPQLSERLKQGLLDSGLNVVDAGLVSTPTFYFTVAYYGYDGGIQVSASHNPKNYNGFKIVLDKAYPVGKNTGLEDIKQLILRQDFVDMSDGAIVFTEDNILEDLMNEQLAEFDLGEIKKFKIVIDAANAMGAMDMEKFFQYLPAEIVKLNFQLDGNFPAHEADPMQECNIKFLRDAVLQHNADFGIAIDGDGDRYFFVDEKGEVLRQEILRAIMAKIELLKNAEALVCYDIRPGKITQDIIEEMHGDKIITPVGHSLIKEIMVENGAVFGGESSGHYFYQAAYGTFEMPVILLLNFLTFLSESDKSFSEIVKPYKKYFHSGEINITLKDTQLAIKKLKEHYADARLNELDGLTVEYDDFWFNVRASNTEPLVRLNLESISQEVTDQKVKEVLGVLS